MATTYQRTLNFRGKSNMWAVRAGDPYPHPYAFSIRYSYEMYGGPSSGSFSIPTRHAWLFPLGRVVRIGPHWVGEVATHRKNDEFSTNIVLVGLSRRLAGTFWRGRFNLTNEDGLTPAAHSINNITDLFEIIRASYTHPTNPNLSIAAMNDSIQRLGLTVEAGDVPSIPNNLKIAPSEFDTESSLKEILDNLCQVRNYGWAVTPDTVNGRYRIQFFPWTEQNPADPEETTIEHIWNTVIIEGIPKPPYETIAWTDDQLWEYYTEFEDRTTGYVYSGNGTSTGHAARFNSQRKIFIYDDAASVVVYGRREYRIEVPYIGAGGIDGEAARVATHFLNKFAWPRKNEAKTDFIKNPSMTVHEALPWEVGARAVSVSVLGNGVLQVTYTVSLGEMLTTEMFKKDLIRLVPAKAGVDDETAPEVSFGLLVNDERSRKPEPIGTPVHITATVVEKGSGLQYEDVNVTCPNLKGKTPTTVTWSWTDGKATEIKCTFRGKRLINPALPPTWDNLRTAEEVRTLVRHPWWVYYINNPGTEENPTKFIDSDGSFIYPRDWVNKYVDASSFNIPYCPHETEDDYPPPSGGRIYGRTYRGDINGGLDFICTNCILGKLCHDLDITRGEVLDERDVMDRTQGRAGDPWDDAIVGGNLKGIDLISLGFVKGTKLEVFISAYDRNGNLAFSEVKTYTVDDDPPAITSSVENTGNNDEEKGIDWREVNDRYRIWCRCNDLSKVKLIEVYWRPPNQPNNWTLRYRWFGVNNGDNTMHYDSSKNQWYTNERTPSTNRKVIYKIEATDVWGNVGRLEDLFIHEKRTGTEEENYQDRTTQQKVDEYDDSTNTPDIDASHIIWGPSGYPNQIRESNLRLWSRVEVATIDGTWTHTNGFSVHYHAGDVLFWQYDATNLTEYRLMGRFDNGRDELEGGTFYLYNPDQKTQVALYAGMEIGGGQVDRIQDPDNATNYLKIDDTTGNLQLYQGGTKSFEVKDDGTLWLGDAFAQTIMKVAQGIGLQFNDAGANPVWSISATGVAQGIKLGFKQG